ncbi:MAG TPA: vegetative protein [Myxococcaceae bacterium]|nr:vegetative protein [Myxococcaceae bacterium]
MAETEAKKKSGNKHKSWPRRAKGGEGKACSVQGCKRPYRAKGYCFFHYKKWRQGDLPHSRYRVCSKTECRKKAMRGGLCEQHYAEHYKKGEAAAAPAAAAPAAPAA